MDLLDKLEIISRVERIKKISSRGKHLSEMNCIDDGEEFMDAYIEEMSDIYEICGELLELLGG